MTIDLKVFCVTCRKTINESGSSFNTKLILEIIRDNPAVTFVKKLIEAVNKSKEFLPISKDCIKADIRNGHYSELLKCKRNGHDLIYEYR